MQLNIYPNEPVRTTLSLVGIFARPSLPIRLSLIVFNVLCIFTILWKRELILKHFKSIKIPIFI